MIEIKDLPKQLQDNTIKDLLEIVIDFANNFHSLYSNIIDEKTILQKLETLHCICFDKNPNNKIKLEPNCSASWNPDQHQITISSKFIKNRDDELKLLIFHELNHVLTEHEVKQEKSCNLNEQINTSENIFDEIMTEYYAVKVYEKSKGETFKPKNLTPANTYTITENNQEYYVKYDGIAYQEYGKLGTMYDLLFGESLMRARLFPKDEQKFIKQFNKTFAKTNFAYNAKSPDHTPYENFIYEKDSVQRHNNSLELFSALLNKNGLKSILNKLGVDKKRDVERKISGLMPINHLNTYENNLKNIFNIYANKNAPQITQQTQQHEFPA